MEQVRPSSEGRGRIVAGVDGSAPSKAALGWAVRQARPARAAVETVTAWECPVTYGLRALVLPARDLEEEAATVLCDSIAEVAAPGEMVTVTSQELVITDPGEPVPVISRVVAGGAARTLLGSVSRHCVQQASCPVVIRDSPAGPGDGGDEG
jgi:nucleotide-binding universal stress UspA family protein